MFAITITIQLSNVESESTYVVCLYDTFQIVLCWLLSKDDGHRE